jgi:nucleoside-diphosphate-sugar epimerase
MNGKNPRGTDEQRLQTLQVPRGNRGVDLFRKKGLPVVIVNPSAPVGPRDVKPTPTGQLIVDFLNRKLPAYLETGLNWVHVRDVAVGHILAAEKGNLGERYILGNPPATGRCRKRSPRWRKSPAFPRRK